MTTLLSCLGAFGNTSQLPDLTLNNTVIAETEFDTHVGLTLNNKITWNNHSDHIITKNVNTLKSDV